MMFLKRLGYLLPWRRRAAERDMQEELRSIAEMADPRELGNLTLAAEDGFVRVIARADNNLVLGIQAVGGAVSELAAAFALAIEMGARLEDVAATIHAHPTQSEAFPEAALKALGRALHA